MKKKHLRRQLEAAEAESARLAAQLAEQAATYERAHEALLSAGYLRVSGTGRSQGDKLRAARSGVLVIGDVLLLQDSEYRIDVDELDTGSLFHAMRSIPGRQHHSATLKFEAEPEILSALRRHITPGRPSAGTGRIQP